MKVMIPLNLQLLIKQVHWSHSSGIVAFRHVYVLLLSEFIVEVREEQHTEEGKWQLWRRVPGDFNHLQLTLHPYCTYRFRVIAVNEIGHSNPSKPSDHHSTPPAGE